MTRKPRAAVRAAEATTGVALLLIMSMGSLLAIMVAGPLMF